VVIGVVAFALLLYSLRSVATSVFLGLFLAIAAEPDDRLAGLSSSGVVLGLLGVPYARMLGGGGGIPRRRTQVGATLGALVCTAVAPTFMITETVC
jgi:hypothetical protein